MADVEFDFSDLEDWQDDLNEAAGKAKSAVSRVVKRGAQNIKDDARRRILSQTRPARTKYYAHSITYDITDGGASAEIGPDRSKRQAALGNLLEFGSVNNSPLPHLNPALEAELPAFEDELSSIAVTITLGGNGG